MQLNHAISKAKDEVINKISATIPMDLQVKRATSL